MVFETDIIADRSLTESSKALRIPVTESIFLDGYRVNIGRSNQLFCCTVDSGNTWKKPHSALSSLSSCIEKLITNSTVNSTSFLVAGIGNRFITSDSLGSLTAKKLSCNVSKNLYVLSPGTPSQTGIDTSRLILSAAECVNADVLLTVDSLATPDINRLGNVIQIHNAGLTPGSALAHTSGEISSDTMPCRVISIGVPTVLYHSEKLLTISECDYVIDFYSSVIAAAVTKTILSRK